MLHARLVKEIEKLGLKIEKCDYHEMKYFSNGPLYYCSWFLQNDNAECVKLCRHTDEDDYNSDYHAGFYTERLKTVKEYLSKGMQCEIEQNASYAMTS